MAVLANVRRVHVCRVLASRFGAVMAAETVAADIDMVKVGRQPAERAVAVIAGGAAGDMGWVLANRNVAIVARDTRADNLAVIDFHDGYKDVRRMTVLANIRRLNMRQTLARRVGAIVAAEAVTADVDMIKVGGNPANRAVTVIAGIATGNVRRIFSVGNPAVMTRHAIANNLCVIDCHGRSERGAVMTILAHVGCQHVVRVLAGCIDTIVAGATRSQDLCVIDRRHRRKRRRAMAVLTDVGGLYMRRVLASRFGAIVAAETIRRDTRMIKIHRQPSRRTVAIIAIGATRNMCRVLAGRNDAVMAGAAGAHDLGMVDRIYRRPDRRCMAVLADIRR